LAKEGRWFVASRPILDIAAQGRTEREAKDNLAALISEYLRDPDPAKPYVYELTDAGRQAFAPGRILGLTC